MKNRGEILRMQNLNKSKIEYYAKGAPYLDKPDCFMVDYSNIRDCDGFDEFLKSLLPLSPHEDGSVKYSKRHMNKCFNDIKTGKWEPTTYNSVHLDGRYYHLGIDLTLCILTLERHPRVNYRIKSYDLLDGYHRLAWAYLNGIEKLSHILVGCPEYPTISFKMAVYKGLKD